MKSSIYNHIINLSKDRIIVYNALTDNLFTANRDEYRLLFKPLLIEPSSFFDKYPTIVKKLKHEGFIVDKSFNELEFIINKNHKEIHHNKEYHITINPTLECNFDCWYCSVKSTVTDVDKMTGSMDKQLLQKLKLHFSDIISNGKFNKIKIDWFGGEPLLYFFDVIEPLSRFLVEKTKNTDVRLSHFITTNAFLMTPKIIKLFDELKINGFQITLDGDKNRHNNIRNENGTPSFSIITNNIRDILNNLTFASSI